MNLQGLLDKVTYKLRANDEKGSVVGRGKCKGCEKAMNLVLSIPCKHQLAEGWRARKRRASNEAGKVSSIQILHSLVEFSTSCES